MNETFLTKNGLRVCYVEKKNFHKSYVGIGLNYGSRDLEFWQNHQKIRSKEGTAHFIEHKLFQMPYGDAFQEFSKYNATANAYTDLEKTLYYFTTPDDLYAPLRLLLEMYFTPFFPKEDVEKEKGIITSEIKMYDDMPMSQFSRKIMEHLYPKSSLAAPVAGTVQSVLETTSDDLEIAYRTFYTTDNSYLVVVSHEPRDKVCQFIENVMSSLNVHRGLPNYILSPIKDTNDKDLIYTANVEQTTATLGIRFSVNQSYPLFCNLIIGILDSLFSPMARYYKELHKKNLFLADIEYSVSTLRDTGYAFIQTTSNQPKRFLDTIQKKLQSLSIKDLDPTITRLYLKHLKAKAILALDSIEELGEEILILALENASYLEELEQGQQLIIEDFYAYVDYFLHAKYVKAICKKKSN